MADIDASVVKKLREQTNVSMMECKRALVDAGGDMAKAGILLRERGIAVATRRASRAANQGLVESAFSADGSIASLVEVNCETDFVARNDAFKAFVAAVARKACETDANLADLMKSEVTAKIAETGENIVIKRNVRFKLQGRGRLGAYIHPGGKVGVLVEAGCEKLDPANADFAELVKDMTLHVAACSPQYLVAKDVPADAIAAEREIYRKQIVNKPPQIIEKIVDGKLKKFFSEVCMVDQIFVKDTKLTVAGLLAARGKALGDVLTVRRFVRYQLGE